MKYIIVLVVIISGWGYLRWFAFIHIHIHIIVVVYAQIITVLSYVDPIIFMSCLLQVLFIVSICMQLVTHWLNYYPWIILIITISINIILYICTLNVLCLIVWIYILYLLSPLICFILFLPFVGNCLEFICFRQYTILYYYFTLFVLFYLWAYLFVFFIFWRLLLGLLLMIWRRLLYYLFLLCLYLLNLWNL